MIKPLEYVAKIKPYVPGKPIQEVERELGLTGSIKLASNENPLGPSGKAMEAVKRFLQSDGELNRYPEGSGYYLKNALSERLSQETGIPVNAGQIILGNGSNELIDIAVRTFVGPGEEGIMATPSFVVYPMAVQSVGGVAKEIPVREYRHDLDGMAKAISERTKIVFIANPNNPTGTINRKDEFEKFMDRVPEGVLVVVDEAYYEYVRDREYPDTFAYFEDRRDVLILRTFSKAYGLAGLRIGYGIAQEHILSEMNKIREPFNTGSLAQLAAHHALADREHLTSTIRMNEDGKEFLYKELDALRIPYVPTEANFIYMPLRFASKVLYDALLYKGVIVRPVGRNEIRVTIGLPEENKRFVEALKAVMHNL